MLLLAYSADAVLHALQLGFECAEVLLQSGYLGGLVREVVEEVSVEPVLGDGESLVDF